MRTAPPIPHSPPPIPHSPLPIPHSPFPLLAAFLLLLPACDADTKNVPSCGDGFRDPGEDCDGADLGEATCGTLGYYDPAGALACRADCTFDVSPCGGRCGDGVIQLERAEECEGDDLAGKTCENLGFPGGTLACDAACHLDRAGCDPLCGNGVADPMEPCDLYDLRNTTCESLGYAGGAIACASNCTFDESACMGVCGDGLMAPDEACEGTNTRGLTCESLGYAGGSLACTPGCALDTSACEGGTTCGDGSLDEGEACDTDDLAGADCVTLGFIGGKLTCGPDCRPDTSRCLGSACGNGHADPGEDCDASDLDAATCVSLGLGAGSLACASDCTFNTVGCATGATCGNGVVEAGETCDGTDFAGDSCDARGFYEGVLACVACTSIDASACAGRCGDGTADLAHGETCDGADLAGATCYVTGTPTCTAACQLDLSACTGYCGDGVVDEAYGEACDGAAMGTLTDTCGELGYAGGTPTCRPDCLAPDYDTCTKWVKVSTGSEISCGIDENTQVWCWGVNRQNGYQVLMLGDGQSTHSYCGYGDCSGIPVRVRNSTDTGYLDSAVDIAVGRQHICATLSDGSAFCWGRNDWGQLGNGSTVDSNYPVQVASLMQISAISDGWTSTCALTTAGTVWCWGLNSSGQLGTGDHVDSSTRVRVIDPSDPTTFLTNVSSVAVGNNHACAVKNDGSMKCWGANTQGQLGTGTNTSENRPVAVRNASNSGDLTGVASCFLGHNFSCAVMLDGSLFCWGENTSGQLGNNTLTSTNLPVQVSGASGLVMFSGAATGEAGSHACATMTDGTLWCWGNNSDGQLGNGSKSNSPLPVQVRGYGEPSISNIETVSCGYGGAGHTSCAIDSDGRMFCWGHQCIGALGNGVIDCSNETGPMTTPVPVHGQGE